MIVDAHGLLALQLLDSELDQIAARRKRLPERAALQEAQAALAKFTADGDVQRALIEAAYTSIEEIEVAAKVLDTKQARLEAQLKTVIAPREAEALMHEIDGLKAKHSDLDDVELAAMEQQSNAETALATMALDEPALLATVAEARASLDAVLALMADEESAVRERRDAAQEAMSEADRRLYTAGRSRHGAVGFCTLERHACTGCHVDLSQVEFEQVLEESKTELAECPHCGRTLIV
ncbi:MAG: hypothetical protein RLZZ623_2093 [Actinomycetota bacterium]